MALPLADNPAFTRLWTAETTTVLAHQMVVVAIGWQLYDLTGRALDLGLVGLANFCAQVLFSLPAGHAADRIDRRRVILLCQIAQAIIATLLAALTHRGLLTAPVMYSCAFAIGAATTFQQPSLRAILPNLVGNRLLPQAIAFSATIKRTAIIIGPALGGVIYIAGPNLVYGLSALLYVAAGIVIATIARPHRSPAREPVTIKFVLGGFAYIWHRPVILGAISLDLFATLLGGLTALLPIYARDILQTGPEGLGLLRAAPAAGAVLASAYLARSPLTRDVGKIMFLSIVIFGTSTVVFGLSALLPLSLIALTILGAFDMVSVVIRTSLIQLETPEEMRGRASAVNSLFTGTSNQLGQFQAGLMATLIGTVPAAVFGGLATLVVAGLWTRLFPQLIKRQTLVRASGSS
jgi:MFS family permease